MTWPHGDPDVVARAVLGQAAYRQAASSTGAARPRSLLELVWSWLVDHVFGPLFAPLAHAFEAVRGVGTAAGVALVVLALLAVGFVVVRLALAFALRPLSGVAGASTPLASAALGASDFRAVARVAAARGDYARAIAALWSAALAVLDERALVAFDPARTPGEYRRLVRRTRAAAAPSFDTLSERFVYATYAAALPSAGDFAAAERALAAFEPAIAGS